MDIQDTGMDIRDRGQDPTDTASRRPGRRAGIWLLAICVIGVAAVAVYWQIVVHPAASEGQYSPPHPPVPLPTSYYGIVEEQIAQGLGVSAAQVRAEVVADPGEGLFGVATARGISPDTLYRTEIAALQTASDQLSATGQWTQAQDDATMRYWRARGDKALGADMTDWFLHY